jgi:hypothetical protein
MEIVIHRVNQREKLRNIPFHYGAEVDVRACGSELVLNHDAFKSGECFIDWLEEYRHGLLILNIKEAGIEQEVIRLVELRGIRQFFLLDVEFPYIYRASRSGERRIAIRYSEEESIETALVYAGRIDWVWIDTNTRLPLDASIVKALNPFRTCLVCPERWGRSEDIRLYQQKMRFIQFAPAAIMTSLLCAPLWEQEFR